MNTILAKITAGIIALMISFTFGVMFEHSRFAEYKGEVKGAANVQELSTKAANTKNEGDANASQENYVQAIKNLDAYYRAHPVVRVQHDGSCSMPEASGNTKIVDGASSSGNAATYASPYSPESTESVAVKLYILQQRLIAGGVNVR